MRNKHPFYLGRWTCKRALTPMRHCTRWFLTRTRLHGCQRQNQIYCMESGILFYLERWMSRLHGVLYAKTFCIQYSTVYVQPFLLSVPYNSDIWTMIARKPIKWKNSNSIFYPYISTDNINYSLLFRRQLYYMPYTKVSPDVHIPGGIHWPHHPCCRECRLIFEYHISKSAAPLNYRFNSWVGAHTVGRYAWLVLLIIVQALILLQRPHVRVVCASPLSNCFLPTIFPYACRYRLRSILSSRLPTLNAFSEKLYNYYSIDFYLLNLVPLCCPRHPMFSNEVHKINYSAVLCSSYKI